MKGTTALDKLTLTPIIRIYSIAAVANAITFSGSSFIASICTLLITTWIYEKHKNWNFERVTKAGRELFRTDQRKHVRASTIRCLTSACSLVIAQ